jgi:hypothetical protein
VLLFNGEDLMGNELNRGGIVVLWGWAALTKHYLAGWPYDRPLNLCASDIDANSNFVHLLLLLSFGLTGYERI